MKKVLYSIAKVAKKEQNKTQKQKITNKIHQGYWRITQLIIDYFATFGIHDALVLEESQLQLNKTFQQKLQIVQKTMKNKQNLLTKLHTQIKEIISHYQKTNIIKKIEISIQDIALFLDSVSKSVDQVFLPQYFQFLLTVFKSIRESQQTINNLIRIFFNSSEFFSMKFNKLRNLSSIKQKNGLNQNTVNKLSRKITKNRKNMLKKKRLQKKNQKKQLQDQQESDQQRSVENQVKNKYIFSEQQIKLKFNKFFREIKNVIQTFIFNREDRNEFLIQQKVKLHLLQLITKENGLQFDKK